MRLSGRKSSPFTQAWKRQPRVALLGLIGANTVAFVTQLFLDAYQPGFSRDYLGLNDIGVRNAYAWQFITSMVMHGGMWHFVTNMLVLYLVGRDVESILGQRNFVLLYMFGGLVGEVGHLFVMPAETVVFAASGGVVAVVFAYATILPELEFSAVSILPPPFRLKAKHVAYAAIVIAVLLLIVDRTGTVTHSVYLGGCVAGWTFAHLLGFGRPSFVQRAVRHRRASADRVRVMTAEEFIAEEVDPLLEKISREGIDSLTRQERRVLEQASEKIAGETSLT